MSRSHRPWSSSGSLVSDRLRTHTPPPKQQQQRQGKGKGKGKGSTPEPPSKSKAVRALDARLDSARRSNGRTKDPKGGCFCQARTHALSSYVKICRQCGLILCTLNPPYYACPHCASALLDEHEREALVRRVEGELAEQLAQEEAARQRAIEEARAAEGAFPTLSGSLAQRQASRTPPPASTTRTVLSLNSETKRVTVASYSTTPASSRPASRGENREEEEEGRVPGPPGEVSHVKEPVDPERPWRNMRLGDVKYVPLPGASSEDTSKPTQNKKRRR